VKKLLALMVAIFLLIPTTVWAEENAELNSPAPVEEVTTETPVQLETTPTVEPTATPIFSFEIFGYTIAVSEVDGLTSVALLKEGEDGSYESLAVYNFGGVLGQAVSTVARTVTPGPAHGKVVSAFVKAVNEQRREKKREEIRERKEAGKGEGETVRNRNQEEKELRKSNQEEKGLGKNEDKGKGKGLKNQKRNNQGSQDTNQDEQGESEGETEQGENLNE